MQRNIALDITKGIGILLVIIGHCGSIPYMPLRHFIFTFHMPLFFLVSGYLYRSKDAKESLKKDFHHLGRPYIITCLAILLYFFLYFIVTKSHNAEPLKTYFIASICGSGTQHSCKFFSDVPTIGAIWFLPALLICKNIYNILPNNQRLLLSSIIFVLATLLGRYLLFLPFSFFSGLSAIIFYAIGDFLKKVKIIPAYFWFLGFICWFVSFKYSHIYIVQPQYDLYFIDVIGATTATILVYLLSSTMTLVPLLSQCLAWTGKNSLPILCCHLIDMDCGISGRLNITGSSSLQIILMLVLPILGALFTRIPIFSRVKECLQI